MGSCLVKCIIFRSEKFCEDAFWDMIDIVEDIRSTGVARGYYDSANRPTTFIRIRSARIDVPACL